MMKAIILGIVLIFSSCSGMKKVSPSMTFSHDVDVSIDGKTKKVAAGKEVDLAQGPVQVDAPGKVSMIIYPVSDPNKNLKVKLPELDSLKVDEFQKSQVNLILDKIMPEVQQVQSMMLQSDYTNALSKIRDLKAQYPGVAYLSFIEGACYSVLNRSQEAVRSLREGLEIYSENPDAKELYRKITGEKN